MPAPQLKDTLEANKEVARRIILEVIDKSNLALADQLIAADYHEHRPGAAPDAGVDGLKDWIRTVHAAFPDWRHTVDDVVAEGDLVTIRNTLYGTHRGEWMGIAPTGRTIEQRGFDQMRIVGGKMVEHWGEYDWIGFYQQLGAFPQEVLDKMHNLDKVRA
jgi:predicted ester cyclase